jgi:hypothetical protein
MKARMPSKNTIDSYLNTSIISTIPSEAQTIKAKLTQILYSETSSSTNSFIHGFLNQEHVEKAWDKKAHELVSYLNALLSSKKITQTAAHDLAVNMQRFVNSRDYEVQNRYERSVSFLGARIVAATKSFKSFDKALSIFISENATPNFSPVSTLLGMMRSVNKSFSELNPLASACLFLVSFQSVLAQAEMPDPKNVVAYFPFNGNALDASGNGHNGIVYRSTLTEDLLGNKNSAYHFNGVNSYIKVNSADFPLGASNRTFALWVRSDSYSGSTIFGYGGAPDTCGTSFLLDVNNKCSVPENTFEIQNNCDVDQMLYTASSLLPSSWMHIAITSSEEDGTRMYLNNSLVKHNPTMYINGTLPGSGLAIGAAVGANGSIPYADKCIGYFEGDIDELIILDIAAPASMIDSLFNRKIPQVKPSSSFDWKDYLPGICASGGVVVAGTLVGALAGFGLFSSCIKKINKKASSEAKVNLLANHDADDVVVGDHDQGLPEGNVYGLNRP